MKRVILLFAALLLASIGWSQTMVITLNDGTTVKYDMGIVKSIEFTDEDSGNGQESTPSIVGTWVYSYSDTWDNITSELGTDTETLYIQFGADGTILRVEIKKNSSVTVKRGSWKLINNYLTITLNGYSTAFDIIDIQSNSLVLSVLGMIVYYERVSDSEIEKYL